MYPEKSISVNQVTAMISDHYDKCHGGVMGDCDLIMKLKKNGKMEIEGWLNSQNNNPVHLFTLFFSVEPNLVT